MSNAMEMAKGMAGIYSGSAYNVVGHQIRGYMSSSRVEGGMGSDLVSSQENTNYYEGKIIDMPDGSVSWTVPWAFVVDELGQYWVKKSFSTSASEGGTAQMDLARVGEHLFVNLEDIEEYDPDFTRVITADPNEYLRVHTSQDQVIKSAIKEKVNEFKKFSALAAYIRDLF